MIRAKGPAVFLAQPEGLGTRCDEQLRAKGPAVCPRQFEVGMLSAAREHGTREHEYGTYGTRAREYGTREHGTRAVAEFDVAPLRTCGLIRAKGPAVFLAQPEGLGTRCDEQLRAQRSGSLSAAGLAGCHVHAFALSMRQFEVGMLSAAREHGTRAPVGVSMAPVRVAPVLLLNLMLRR